MSKLQNQFSPTWPKSHVIFLSNFNNNQPAATETENNILTK